MKIYTSILQSRKKGKKQFAVLVDPDKQTAATARSTALLAKKAGVDFFFVGSSILVQDNQDKIISVLKEHCDIPVLLFPGNTMQLNARADGILLLSLISGRNPELLIGQHVLAAPFLKASRMEVIPTGYMLIDNGKPTTVSYMSNTLPIPADKDDVAVCTAMAGELLGLKLIYMDAGSGASNHVRPSMVKRVRENTELPIIVGGGITTPEKARLLLNAGADVIVVGNAIEKNPGLILKIAEKIK
jgi:phosphoglycerol geranylgeranyltransferase